MSIGEDENIVSDYQLKNNKDYKKKLDFKSRNARATGGSSEVIYASSRNDIRPAGESSEMSTPL